MPKVRNILPKKERGSGAGHAVRPFTHSMEEFFGNHFPRHWMEGFFEPEVRRWPFWGDVEQTFDVFPKVDIVDRDEALIVRAEMPGIRKEDLDITLTGDRLTLEARREFKEEEKKEDFYRHEMAYGRLYRAIHLPVEIKVDDVKAELAEGILEIYLPKVEATEPLKVEVA